MMRVLPTVSVPSPFVVTNNTNNNFNNGLQMNMPFFSNGQFTFPVEYRNPTPFNFMNEDNTQSNCADPSSSDSEFLEPTFPEIQNVDDSDTSRVLQLFDDAFAFGQNPIDNQVLNNLLQQPQHQQFIKIEPVELKEEEQVQMQIVQDRKSFAVVPKGQPMESFPSEQVVDFKHLIYNLLVENHNDPLNCTFVRPCSVEVFPGVVRDGFQFNESENPDKKLPELYAQHIRKADLQMENHSSVFIQDLYKFYLRACVELLSKYFEKKDKYTFLYDDIPLFVAGGCLEDAEDRISKMGTRQRKHKRAQSVSDKKQDKLGKHKRNHSLDSSTALGIRPDGTLQKSKKRKPKN